MSDILPNIIQVFETEYKTKVNEYLDLGWILLNTYTTCYDTEPPRCYHQTLHYVLGWCASNGEVKIPPEPKSIYDILL